MARYGESDHQRPMRSQMIWAAFNPDTGYVLAPTIAASKAVCEAARNRFYEGCPIYECLIQPVAKLRERGGKR